MAASIKVPTIFTAQDKFSKVVMGMTKSMTTFGNTTVAYMSRIDASVNKTFGKIKKLGSTAGIFGAFALFGVLSDGVRTIANYEQANANLAAVLEINIDQTKELQNSSKLLGATTSFTASEVAGLQTEYAKLGFAESEILKVTASTLDLAAATRTELPQAAKQVGETLRQFSLDSSNASMVSDTFAKASSKSALNMEYLANAMSTVAPVANKFGFGVKDVTALLGNLADSGFDASSAATATRNIFLNLADANGLLAKALGKPVKDLPSLVKGLNDLKERGIDLAGALELTDKRSVAAFATFLDGTKNIEKLSIELNKAGGAAKAMADKQLNTLTGRFTILKSAYEGFILGLDEGNGVFSTFAKNTLEVATDMLGLANGTEKATEALNTHESKVRSYANMLLNVLGTLKFLFKAWLLMKVLLIASNVYMAAQNTLLGINTFLTRSNAGATLLNSGALKGNIIATKVFNALMWARNVLIKSSITWTYAIMAAQSLWSSVVSASTVIMGAFGIAVNSALWPILLVAAAIAAIILIFKNWGAITEWFSGLWTSLTDYISMRWNNITSMFKSGDILGAFKEIGKVIIDWMLWPLKNVLKLVSLIPGSIGDLASRGLSELDNLTSTLSVNDNTEKKPIAGPEQRSADRIEKSVNENNLNLTIKDPGGFIDEDNSTNNGFPIDLSNTYAF